MTEPMKCADCGQMECRNELHHDAVTPAAPPDVADLVRRLKNRSENASKLRVREFDSGVLHASDADLFLDAADALDAHSAKENARPNGARETDSGGCSHPLAPAFAQAYFYRELSAYLDSIAITSENIGDVRRQLFEPWASAWNGVVRDETAARENKVPPLPSPPSETLDEK